MRLRIEHHTTYTFQEPAAFGLQQLRLTPKSRIGQSVLTWETRIDGGQRELDYEDQHMNKVTLISFTGDISRIEVVSAGEVETADMAGVVGKHAGFAPLWYFQRTTPLTRPGSGVRSLAKGLGAEIEDPVARCHALSDRVAAAVTYQGGTTDSQTTAEQAIANGAGVCQDHAHIFIAAARQLGFPARYVSGYLMMDDRVSQDATHGWAEVYVAPLGWIGFDVSNAICPDERYVRVATGLDYTEAAPIIGLRDQAAAGETLTVDIAVEQIVDDAGQTQVQQQ